jgi:hypothetical protein
MQIPFCTSEPLNSHLSIGSVVLLATLTLCGLLYHFASWGTAHTEDMRYLFPRAVRLQNPIVFFSDTIYIQVVIGEVFNSFIFVTTLQVPGPPWRYSTDPLPLPKCSMHTNRESLYVRFVASMSGGVLITARRCTRECWLHSTKGMQTKGLLSLLARRA